MCVNLDDTGAVVGSLPGVDIYDSVPSLINGKPCSRQVVLRVGFLRDNILDPCPPDSLFNNKVLPQRMLKIQMYFSDGERSEYMFNIGDSRTNEGDGGDAYTQSHDAEVLGLAKNITVYGSGSGGQCQTQILQNHIDALKHPASMTNMWIRNRYLKMTNDHVLMHTGCNNCLFALHNHYDAEGQENDEIYIGANRVISTSTRSGVGQCRIKL